MATAAIWASAAAAGAAGAIAVAHEASPDGSRADVDRQDAPIEPSGEVLLDSSLESFAPFLFPCLRSASNDLSDGLGGEEEIRRVLGFHPVEDRLPGS